MKLRVLIIIACVLAGLQTASAEVLTLDQCINTALQHNFGVQAARNSYEASRAQTYTAWGAILPSISISASANRSWTGYPRRTVIIDTVTMDTTILREPNISKSYSGALSFGVTYNGLGVGTYANFKRLHHARSSSYYNLTSTQSEIVQQVKSDYYGVVRTKTLVGVAIDAVKRSQEGLRVAQSRYELGAASMSDVLKARVQLGNDQLDSVIQANSYQLALANLAFDLGVDVNRGIEIDENLPPTQFDMSYDAVLDEAMLKNPDFRKAQFDLAVAKDSKLLACSDLLPSISFNLTHGTDVNKFGDLFTFKQDNAGYSMSATLRFNIFNGFNDYAAIKTARESEKTSQENLFNTQNRVALLVKQAFLALSQADESKRLSNESVASAQEDLNLVKEKYSLGAATILDLLTAEASLTQAQQNQVQAVYDYNVAVSQVDKVLGR
ncbi:MAG TPA: hypothetical protein DEO84_02165 [candidate division Zixibacteria bacterium]|nr:hypothetical protein [candidate division Zixibacteria bacterium]HBZ00102.1 hypothetical protein [candidate division Zixibacteria bacterium]